MQLPLQIVMCVSEVDVVLMVALISKVHYEHATLTLFLMDQWYRQRPYLIVH